MNSFDLIIVGGGAGAFAAAIRANKLGAKTLLVNKGLPLGGTCVNVGCVPSKTLLWAGEVMHQAKKFIIATGSTATVPEIEGVHNVGFVIHIEALKLKTQPKELIVVGAGPVGLEFAQMYARFGTKVTILHHSESIFSRAEAQLTSRLQEILQQEGIVIKTNAKVKSARKDGDRKVVQYELNGETGEVTADEILLAVGKTPNTKELHLEAAKVEVNERQAVKVDPQFQSSQQHIFAVGDVTDEPLRLETTAGREATLILSPGRYSPIPNWPVLEFSDALQFPGQFLPRQ